MILRIRSLTFALCLVLTALPATAGDLTRGVPGDVGLAGTPFEILTKTAAQGELAPLVAVVVARGDRVVYEETFADPADRADRDGASDPAELLKLGHNRLATGDPTGHGETGNDVWHGGDWPLGDGDVESFWLDDDSGGRVVVFPELDIVTVVTVDPKRAGDLPRVVGMVIEDYVLEAVELGHG